MGDDVRLPLVASWVDVSRLLRAAGWRHGRVWQEGGRGADGAPLDDGYLEHVWRRDGTAIWAVSDFGGPVRDYLSYVDEEGSDEFVSVHVGMVERRGFEWLVCLMAHCDIVSTHVYFSTACRHGAHEVCQIDTFRFDGTYKVAAVCKWCSTPCVCGCHRDSVEEVLTRT